MSDPIESPRYAKPLNQYLDAVISPGKAFRGLRTRPRWLVFFLITIAASVAVLYFLMPYNLEAQRDAIDHIVKENREAMSEEQIAGYEAYKETIGTGFMGRVLPYIVVPVSFFLYLLIASAGLNIGVGMTGEKLGFRNAVSIVSLASVTMAVGALVTMALILVKGDIYVGANLGLLFPRWPTEGFMRFLKGFLSQIGVFSAWSVYLLTVGVREVTGLSTKRAFRVIIILWLLWAISMACLSLLGFGM